MDQVISVLLHNANTDIWKFAKFQTEN
jgi:hypothetical protein